MEKVSQEKTTTTDNRNTVRNKGITMLYSKNLKESKYIDHSTRCKPLINSSNQKGKKEKYTKEYRNKPHKFRN